MLLSFKELHKNKKRYYLPLFIISALSSLLYATAFSNSKTIIEVKKSDLYPNGICISTTTTRGLTPEEISNHIGSLAALIEQGNMQALKSLNALAEGNAEAKTQLGTLYLLGRGVEKNIEKAFELYTEAARTDIRAQLNLGTMYLKGYYVKQDLQKAAYFYRQASENNAVPFLELKGWAMLELADLYWKGRGVERNIEKTINLCQSILKLNFDTSKKKSFTRTSFDTLHVISEPSDALKKYSIALLGVCILKERITQKRKNTLFKFQKTRLQHAI